jgi:hypothetical protein
MGEAHIILLLDEKEVSKGVVRTAIVDWCSDITVRILENRMVYFYPDGTTIYGKCKGFTYNDFQLLIVNKDKILELLRKGPPEYYSKEGPRGE